MLLTFEIACHQFAQCVIHNESETLHRSIIYTEMATDPITDSNKTLSSNEMDIENFNTQYGWPYTSKNR